MPFSRNRNSRDDNSKRSRSNSENFKSKGNNSRSEKSSGYNDNKSPRKSFSKSSDSNDRPDRFEKTEGGKTGGYKKSFDGKKSFGEKRSFGEKKAFGDKKAYGDKKTFGEKSAFGEKKAYGDRKPFGDKKAYGDRKSGSDKRFGDQKFSKSGPRDKNRDFGDNRKFDKPYKKSFEKTEDGEQRTFAKRRPSSRTVKQATSDYDDNGMIRLNRYISNAGICSRRKADELITAGVISVNGEVVTELGSKVDPAKDEIKYNGERLKREKMVYVLLNKPKDYITTTDDPQERRTVMQLVANATKERIYPVGRLDRNTTGLLLLTNDGNLAEKLSHPRNNISKIYNVELDKSLNQGDFNKIVFGLELEDGFVKPDDLSYVQGGSKREVGIQIHSGKNRIVRRIFESLGYDVVKLDRVVYANLTKKDLPRGRWRYLEEKELIQLKHLI
ncbi:pseudouridine synthase [Sphingobacterium spiritivorum]|uniref:pseudouridine synthase n=1 Tax=Sphingobacterium spiritivorum TaxID=258 RepID=UPI003DA2A4BD